MKLYKFWGGFCSQWAESPMIIDGVHYNTAEQYMMHQKALLFKDYDIADQIMKESQPYKQKALGKLVKNFDRSLWDRHCFSIVYKGNLNKFLQNEELLSELVHLDADIIVEASPQDYIWGIFLSENDPRADDPTQWQGTNLLGFVLTTLKIQLSKNENSSNNRKISDRSSDSGTHAFLNES